MNDLTGRVLVLVAHADDESVCYGALMQRMRGAVVVIATDGAPRDEYFWGRFGSREAYAAVRRDEARRALRLAGVRELVLLAEEDSRLEDQRLFLNLAAAHERLQRLLQRVKPEVILTLAYEGGHPDHDSCSVLGARLGRQFGVPVWETPVYSRAYEQARTNPPSDRKQDGRIGPPLAVVGAPADPTLGNNGLASVTGEASNGKMRIQQFIHETGDEVAVQIAERELEIKRAMCAQYVSQGEFLQTFDVRREVVRPQVRYDYGRPPHEGRTNYEQWQWWMKVQEVCAKFEEFLGSEL
jgi:LmbE family N-acetylglucosaminyl deacetylase